MRDIRKRRIIILILAAAAILLATGAYISVPSGVKDIEIVTSDGERIEESYDVYIGETIELRCRISPKSFAHREVDYYVSDEEILSVDKSGKISGIKEGQTKLIVECAGVRKNVSVDVEPSVKEIKGLEKEITLYVDDEYQFEPEVVMADEDLEAPAVKYSTKRKTVATVDNNGLLTATGEGTTKINIKVGTLSETVKVKVEEKPVDVEPASYTSNNSKSSSDSKKNASNKSSRSSRKSSKSNRKTKTGNTDKQDSGSSGNSVPDKDSDTDDNTESGIESGNSESSSDTVDNKGTDGTGNSESSNTGSDGSGDSADSGTDSNISGNSGSNSGSGSSDSGSSESTDSNSGSSGSGSSSTGSNSASDPNSQTDANLTGE